MPVLSLRRRLISRLSEAGCVRALSHSVPHNLSQIQECEGAFVLLRDFRETVPQQLLTMRVVTQDYLAGAQPHAHLSPQRLRRRSAAATLIAFDA